MSERKKTKMTIFRLIAKTLKMGAFALLLFSGFSIMAVEVSMASDIAIKGYDTVAYFKDNKAQKGTEAFTVPWHGMTWQFLSKENKELFAANPEKYAPQYDGYCSWAMTESRKAVTDPEVWKIVDGKLYLNCSSAAYEKWSKDIPGNIKKADAIWLQLQGGK